MTFTLTGMDKHLLSDSMAAFEKAWELVKRDGKDYGQMPIKESTAMTHGTDLPSLKTIGRSQRKTRK